MTAKEKVAQRKLSMLQLAEELGNVENQGHDFNLIVRIRVPAWKMINPGKGYSFHIELRGF